MEEKLITIGEASKLMGVSIDTLRRMDEDGRFSSIRQGDKSYRYYRKKDIDIYLSDLLRLAKKWISEDNVILPAELYCQNSAVFQSRLSKLQDNLGKVTNEDIKKIFPLVVAVTGEIGDNSFAHNIGNWPDVPGIFFGFDIIKRQVVLADRGQGILKTLKRVRPELEDDMQALKVAFTEVVSGRAPEERGNGLKFVRAVVVKSLVGLYFQTGNAELDLEKDGSELHIKKTDSNFRGCIALITF